MILDVGPLLRGEVDRIDIDYMLSPEKLEGITLDADAHVTGCLTDNAGYMRLVLKAELEYSGECARCLAPVHGVFTLDFERTVVTEGTLSEEQLEEHFDEYAVLEKSMLDVDEPLREELILGFPMRILCSLRVQYPLKQAFRAFPAILQFVLHNDEDIHQAGSQIFLSIPDNGS